MAKALGAAFSHARASGKDQSHAAQRRRANAWLRREGKATMSRKVAKGILDRWRAMSTDERADEFNLRAAGVPPDVARALAMTGHGKAPKRKPKFGDAVSKMGPTLAELDAPGHSTGLTGSQALRGATWRRRKRIDKLADEMVARVSKAGNFDESKHPRADNGQFGEGSGGGGTKQTPSASRSDVDETTAAKKIPIKGRLPKDLHNYGVSELNTAIEEHKTAMKESFRKDEAAGKDPLNTKGSEYSRIGGRIDKLRKERDKQHGQESSKRTATGLSADEKAALVGYQKLGEKEWDYAAIIRAERKDFVPTTAQEVRNKRTASHLTAAVSRERTSKEMALHRGSYLPEGIKAGDNVALRDLTSFTEEPRIAASFANRLDPKVGSKTIIHVTAPAGSNLLDVNHHTAQEGGSAHEKEHIAGPGHSLRIDSVKSGDDGLRHVYATLQRSDDNKSSVAKRHMVSQIAGQMIAAAYEPPRLPAGEPTYTDPPEFARYLDAQRLVAGMDQELSVDPTQTPAQARRRASRTLATSMGAYEKVIAGPDRALGGVGGLNLDLGSGQARERGHLGIDLYPYDFGTVVADLGMGIPFPDSSTRAVRLVDALQQMPDYTADATALMLEVQRVLVIGGRFYYRGPALQDIVDWSKLPGLGVVSHQFSDGGRTLSLTLQRQAARLPLVYGADVSELSRPEALPSDIAQSRAQYGDLPAASVAMANLVGKQHVDVQASIVRKRDYDRVVLGPILIPDVPDSQNDTMTARDIEQTAHNFLADARLVGREHSDTWEGAQVVESYIAPCELSFADEMYGPQVVPKGSWILGVRIPEESWADVLDGSVTGFSVGGWGERTDVDDASSSIAV